MEKLTDYTCNPEYSTAYTQKIANQGTFISYVQNNSTYGNFAISHLRKYDAQLLRQAFEVNLRITAYWTIVVRRIVDFVALYIQYTVKSLVNGWFHDEILAEMVNRGGGGDVEKMMMEESPSMAKKREKLENSIKRLKECKEAVADIVSGFGDF